MEHLLLTFNLRISTNHDKENAWPYRLDSIITYLNDRKPLIFGTQEGVEGMIDDLCENLHDYQYIGVPRSNNKFNAEYNAIFYNSDILRVRKSETIWISKTPMIPNTKDFKASLPRIITYGEFYFIKNPFLRFRFYNTHLDHESELARVEGAKMLRDLINEHNQKEVLPLIITGDFNATKNDDSLYYLRHFASLIHANELISEDNFGTTFHNFTGTKEGLPIDHIFVNDLIKLNKVAIFQEKVKGKFLSDHYPIEAYFEFK